LRQLQRHDPALIGLNLYRDVPVHIGFSDLQDQLLQADNLIAVTQLGTNNDTFIPPPPNFPPERVGFNDLVSDTDGVVRRNLLFGSRPDGEATYYSFSLQLALRYLEAQGILPEPSDRNPDYLQLGDAVFEPLQPVSGGYTHVDAQGYQVLLNYRQEEIARTVSATDVLTRSVPDEWIRDKIVLIGTVAPSGKDLFFTPFSGGSTSDSKMPGVVVHAQMLSQILDAATGARPLFRYWPEWAEVLWILVWALFGGTVAWKVRHTLVLIGAGLLGTVVLGILSFQLFLQSVWIPVLAPAIAMVAMEGAMTAYRAQRAHRQQQMVMTLLGQNTSPAVAQALWQNRDHLLQSGKLPGQKLTATLLFSDLQNFSAIAEQMPPEQLLNWLNEYLGAMTEEVQRHDGIINKFTGDGLMAVFGVPVERLDAAEIATDAQNAVLCALKMGERLQELHTEWQVRHLPPVQMRIGIYTGPIVAGSLGSKERLEYGVIGDSVNIASRLESCEKDRQPGICRILITDDTLQYLTADFKIEAWGPMALKGRQQLVQVHRVVGLAESLLPASPENAEPEKNAKNAKA
jgi:CHASE2 domain-containing sensor protein